MASDELQVEVVYATSQEQVVVELALPVGSTVGDAITRSGLLARFPEIDLGRNRVGVFGVLADLADPLEDGARVEIYRPLIANPKDVRRRRAAAQRKAR
jgi:hypothetical protein